MRPDEQKHHISRGAVSNRHGRHATTTATTEDDGWYREEAASSPQTELFVDHAKTVITRNRSPDVPFDRSINPYKGCEHGCIYCFARQTHSYLDLSPGLDFETKIFYKPDAVARLREELAARGYRQQRIAPIAFGTNTDPWQPAEKQLQLTRALLELLLECRHPVTIVTKGALILRDVDLLAKFAERNLVQVMLSVTTLDNRSKATLEPRTASPATRLRAIRELAAAQVPVGVLAAPMIPYINDHELEDILEAAREAGAGSAGYLLVRLPFEVKDLFTDWLRQHYPERAEKVLSVLADARGGRANDPRFHTRQTGEGPFAQLLAQRFRVAAKKLGYPARSERPPLDCTQFVPPRLATPQGELFS